MHLEYDLQSMNENFVIFHKYLRLKNNLVDLECTCDRILLYIL